MAAHSPGDESSLVDLLKQLAAEVLSLVRQEIALARSEMSEKMTRVVRSLAALVVGVVGAACGAVFVVLSASQAAVMGLMAIGVGGAAARALGPLVVGTLVLAASASLLTRALRRLAQESVVPERTVRTLAEEKQWLSERLT